MYADCIRLYRTQKGLSQQTLGEMLGVSSVAVGKWERGQTQPDIPTLLKMADIFQVSIDDLCDRQPAEDAHISVMTRAFGRMTQEEQEKFLDVGRVLFAHAFEEKKE